MSSEFITKIIDLFKRRIGFKADVFKEQAWENLVAERMRLLGVLSQEDYYQRLVSSQDELLCLIELIVVPETWFFREPAALEYVANAIRNDEQKTYRILHVACSTGEEPYSLCMLLRLEQIPRHCYVIEAIDISDRAITSAKEGVYRPKAFRGNRLDFRDQFFEKKGNLYNINVNIKRNVNFHVGNVLSAEFMYGAAKFDYIFCRNLFIYLTDDSQQIILQKLAALLAPQGVLFVGCTEGEIVRRCGWIQKGNALLSAFTPPLAKQSVSPEDATVQLKGNNRLGQLSSLFLAEEVVSLQEAFALADNGRYEEALGMCVNYIKKQGSTDPQAYFLMGVIEHARGRNDMAENYFNKAIYLQPDHSETLAYLALLAEQKGDIERADVFRRRLKRAERADE